MANTNLDFTIQVRLPKSVVERINALINHKRGMNRSDVVRGMIMDWLDEHNE